MTEETTTVKVMTTDMLDRVAKESRKHGFNRQLDQDWINAHVKWGAIHVIEWTMPHEHIAGQAADMHYRCMAIIGTKDHATQSVTIDMTTERYNSLPTATITTDEHGEKSVSFDRLATV